MPKNYASYHVGLKILLRKGEEYLFLIDEATKFLDLPGGRIDSDEGYEPLEKIIDREVKEELGTDVHYELGKPAFLYRRHTEEIDRHVFLVVYEAKHKSGDIKLSGEHSEELWINPKTHQWTLEEFGRQEEYEAFKNYFESLG